MAKEKRFTNILEQNNYNTDIPNLTIPTPASFASLAASSSFSVVSQENNPITGTDRMLSSNLDVDSSSLSYLKLRQSYVKTPGSKEDLENNGFEFSIQKESDEISAGYSVC